MSSYTINGPTTVRATEDMKGKDHKSPPEYEEQRPNTHLYMINVNLRQADLNDSKSCPNIANDTFGDHVQNETL